MALMTSTSPRTVGGRSSRLSDVFNSPAVVRTSVVIAMLAIWEISVRAFGDQLFIAPPSRIFLSFAELLAEPGVLQAVAMALIEILVGFVLAVTIGVPIGMLIGLNTFLRHTISPIIYLLAGTPQAVFLPLIILVFGLGATSKIVYGFTHGIFPIIITVAAGSQNLNPTFLAVARSMGATNRQILWSIAVPHAVPSVFSGMRLGMSGVLLGILIAELYVSTRGFGYFMRLFTDTFAPDKAFALVILLALFAISLNEICRRAEEYFSRWRN